MKLRQLLLKIAGKDGFQLDSRITNGYLFRICWRYGWMMVRGRLCSLGRNGISGHAFIGRGVKLYCKSSISIGAKAKIHEGVRIDALSTDGVSIGTGAVIGRNTVMECTGSLEHIGKGIVIGNRSCFGADCFFGAAGGILVGDDVIGGQCIRFHSENHNYGELETLIRDQGVTHQGIRVGNNCWIGAGAVFLDGAEIGDGCVVAANAVVTKKFPANAVIGGVPARILKMRDTK